MTPALALIITLQNAIVTCEQHAHTTATTLIYERGFEQCAYLVPQATKVVNAFFAGPGPAERLADDKAIVAKAVAALAAHR